MLQNILPRCCQTTLDREFTDQCSKTSRKYTRIGAPSFSHRSSGMSLHMPGLFEGKPIHLSCIHRSVQPAVAAQFCPVTRIDAWQATGSGQPSSSAASPHPENKLLQCANPSRVPRQSSHCKSHLIYSMNHVLAACWG